MRFWTTGSGLCATAVLAALSAAAQTPPPASPITRTVIAATKLASVVETPLHFKALRVTIAPGEKSSVSAANGFVYQLSGSTEVSLAGGAKTLRAGEGLFLPAGKTAALTAGSGEPSTF